MEGMQNREDFGTVNFASSFPKVPVGISIVDGHIFWNDWRWKVCKGIESIPAIYIVPKAGRQREDKR